MIRLVNARRFAVLTGYVIPLAVLATAGCAQLSRHANGSPPIARLPIPPFGNLVGQLFAKSDGNQQACVLDQLLAVAGPTLLSEAAGGALSSLLPAGASQINAEQAAQLSPEQVQETGAHSERAHPGVVGQLGHFYAEHPTLIKTLGGAAMTIALAKMKEHQQVLNTFHLSTEIEQ